MGNEVCSLLNELNVIKDRDDIQQDILRETVTGNEPIFGQAPVQMLPEEIDEIYESGIMAMANGGRIGFADGPVLPPDTTQPVNPFGPKPGDFGIEEDIPIKMASNLQNDKILEMLFEKLSSLLLKTAWDLVQNSLFFLDSPCPITNSLLQYLQFLI